MTLKTKVKAGGLSYSHNETLYSGLRQPPTK
jgi:hypothetical protein